MNNNTNKRHKIKEFFSTIYSLTLFTIKSFYIIISEDMKKEARTYKEEREQQQRQQQKKIR